jgi:hypothetical protein
MKKILKNIVYVNFLSPMLVLIMFINPLSKDLVVPDYISSGMFDFQKFFVVIIAIGVRAFTFREECQFQFNESYYLVRKIVEDKNEKLFKYIQLRMKENFFNTWYNVF